MNFRKLMAVSAVSSMLFAPLVDAADTPEMSLKRTTSLMSQEEQDDYLAKLRAATSAEERDQVRKEYYEKMTIRATGEEADLPTEAPASGGTATE